MPQKSLRRPLLVSVAAACGAAALVLGGAGAASAHVSVQSDNVEAGAYAVLTFSVPHGCDGTATTSVSIQIPEGINAVTPTRNGFYTVEKVTEALAQPITDSHGNEVTERIAEVVYTAQSPLADGFRDAFELSVKLPEKAAGQTLYFPTIQTCEQGETAWVQMPAEGQDPHDLAAPAPSLEVVAAADHGDGHEHGSTDGATEQDGEHDGHAADAAADSSPTVPLVVAALAIGSLGLIAGVVALLRGRKKA